MRLVLIDGECMAGRPHDDVVALLGERWKSGNSVALGLAADAKSDGPGAAQEISGFGRCPVSPDDGDAGHHRWVWLRHDRVEDTHAGCRASCAGRVGADELCWAELGSIFLVIVFSYYYHIVVDPWSGGYIHP